MLFFNANVLIAYLGYRIAKIMNLDEMTDDNFT